MATMPESVTRYLDVAAEGDVATLLDCFTDDAVVHDEGQTFHGHDEIERWRETVTSRFTYTVTVLGSEKVSPDTWVVPVRLDGNFPGGTAHLQFLFTLRDGLISQLTIAP